MLQLGNDDIVSASLGRMWKLVSGRCARQPTPVHAFCGAPHDPLGLAAICALAAQALDQRHASRDEPAWRE